LGNTDITVSLGVVRMVLMKKFVLIYHGYETSTPEAREAWRDWLQRRAASLADVGNSFGPGRQITNDRTIELSLRSNPASGYSVVNAEHIDAAEQLLEGCPIVDSVSLYEALPMGEPA
jgi:hypothetical protein